MSARSRSLRTLALVLGMVSLVAATVSLGWGQRLVEPESTGVDTYASGPVGHEALTVLWRELGVHVLQDREGRWAEATAPVWFIEPDPYVVHQGKEVSLAAVLQQRRYAGLDSVVVLPKWWTDRLAADGDEAPVLRVNRWHAMEVLGAALPGIGLELRREDLEIPETAMLRTWTVPTNEGPRHVTLLERQTLRFFDDDLEALVGTPSSALVVRTKPHDGLGRITVVSDADLLHNFNLHRGEHAEIVLSLTRDTVVIDEVFHGHGHALTLGAVLSRFPASLLVVHALFVALLVALASTARFGPPRVARRAKPSSAGARVELLGRVLSARRGRRELVRRYVLWVVADTADRLRVARSHDLAARAQTLDTIAARLGLRSRAGALVRACTQKSTAHDTNMAREAHALRKGLLATTKGRRT